MPHSITLTFEEPGDENSRAMLAMYDVLTAERPCLSSAEMMHYIFDALNQVCYTGIIEDEDTMNGIVRNCQEIINHLNKKCECGHLLEDHSTRHQCKRNCDCTGFSEPLDLDGIDSLPLAE